MFGISTAKQEVLEKLVERDWSPTELAEELGKSSATVYNHLNELAEQGVLTKREVAAKTRPKTEYSIGEGFVQYVAVLPGVFAEGALALDAHKAAILRIWLVPQPGFHPFLEAVWEDLEAEAGLRAAGVYGSVARGEAGPDSDIDLFVLAADEDAAKRLEAAYGSVRVTVDGESRLCLTEVFTVTEYRNSVAHGSDFLANVRGELHVIHDPDRLLSRPEEAVVS